MGTNREIVERFYEDWNSGNTEPAPEISDNVEWVNPPSAVEPGIRRGRGGFREAMARVRSSFSEFRIEVENMREVGDRLLVVMNQHVTGSESGMKMTFLQSQIWTFREGRVVRFQWFPSVEEGERAFEEPA